MIVPLKNNCCGLTSAALVQFAWLFCTFKANLEVPLKRRICTGYQTPKPTVKILVP